MNLFLKRNIITGEDYKIDEENRYDYHQEIARAAYTDMLHDTERNQLYEVGLKNAIMKMHSQGREAYVLDIGTGSGLLSMMAYRNGADKITACEAFAPMAECAFKVISNNSMEDKIEIISKRSTNMTVGEIGCDMPRRANILVTEVYDTELIGEGAIPTFEHAHRILLEDDCIVIPSVANMYIQCVNSDLVRNWNVFTNIKLNDISNVDGTLNEIIVPDDILKCSGISGVHDLQLDQVSEKDFTALSQPIRVFRFDYSGKTPIMNTGQSSTIISALSNGSCDGIFMWWDLEMTPNGSEVILSCAPRWAHPTPSNMQWRDHWMQSIYYPLSSIDFVKGIDYRLDCFHDEYSLWFDINLPEIKINRSDIRVNSPPLCNCGCHLNCCRTRIGMLNDHKRLNKYTKAMKKCININTICLSISNGSFLPLIASKLGAKKVFVLEDNHLCKIMIEKYIKVNSIDSIIFIEEKDLVHSQVFNGAKIDLVIAEPYFMESTLPWHDLYYAYIINKITNHLSNNVIIIPKECHLKAIAAEFKHLHKIRSVLETCEGFRMLSFDSLIMASSKKVDEQIEPHPLWEYPATPVTNVFHLNSFKVSNDHTKSFIHKKINSSKTIDFIKSESQFNGVALWMDYNLDDEFYISNGLTSDPQKDVIMNWYYYCRQGLHLIDNPKKINRDEKLTYSFEYNPKNGCIDLDFTVI